MFLLIPIFVILSALLLICSKDAVALAGLGLTLWFENMVPTLLPFMILSGIMTNLNLQYALGRPLRKINQLLFSVSGNGTYCIFMGYLCGFPMGAFCASDLCKKGMISKEEAQYMIAFCNHIGPVYFYSFALSMVGFVKPAVTDYIILTLGMYGIPFLYGIGMNLCKKRHGIRGCFASGTEPLKKEQNQNPISENRQLFSAIDRSINRAGNSILRLCGYMVLFNVLMLPVYRFMGNGAVSRCLHCFFEISGGLRMLHPMLAHPYTVAVFSMQVPFYPVLMLTALSFGGLSCIGQTSVFLHEADLSIRYYVKHRIVIAVLSMLFFIVCFGNGFLSV